MVTRNYQAPEFNVQDRRTVEQRDVAQADTRVKPIAVGDDSWRDRLLEDIAGVGSKVLNQMADIEYSNLYLEGQAAAGQVESEDELQGNPLTRDWKLAGYRDTMGKLALSDMEATLAVDMMSLREKSPEEMQRYLAKRRAKFLPGMNSMSREARATSAGQLLLQERAAIKMHTSEHTKFIIEKKAQAITSQFDTSIRGLQSAVLLSSLPNSEITPDALAERIRGTVGTMVGSIWLDPSLPEDVKRQLTVEATQRALADDIVPLYDYIANNEVPDGKGGMSTMLSRLDGEERTKLSNAYRESMARTKDQRNLHRHAQVADLETQIDNGAYQGDYAHLTSVLDPMVLHKSITGEKRQSLIAKFLDGQYKRAKQGGLAEAYLRGDLQAILGSGGTVAEGVEALEATMARNGFSPEKRLSTWLTAGVQGMEGGFKKAGEQLGVALRQIRQPDGTVLPQHLETFKAVNAALRQAEANGHANTRSHLLSGLNEADRMYAERIFAMTSGSSPMSFDDAALRAKDLETKEAQMTPALRAAASATQASEVSTQIATIEPIGLLGTFWNGVKSLVGLGDGLADLRPKTYIGAEGSFDALGRNWDDDDATVRFYTNAAQQELSAEASHVMLTHPGAKSGEVLNTARGGLMARTVQTKHGPVFLPRNTDTQALFGVPAAMQSLVGKSIESILPESKAGGRWEIKYSEGAGLLATERDKTGVRIRETLLAPSEIKAGVMRLQERNLKQADERMGKGRTVKADGVTLSYSGRNSAGVEYDWMFDYRTNLVNHEGVRGVAYDDLSGKLDKDGNRIRTVGVGVSSHNPHFPKEVGPDGRVPDHAIQRAFIEASNDAAEAGAREARNVGVFNKSGFMLMSELAYQSGTAFLSQRNSTGEAYRKFALALASRNSQAAQEAFKRTAAWRWSRDPKNPSVVTRRQKAYLDMIERTTKE